MKSKCDKCVHNVLSDETSVGAGWIPFCNKGYWSGCTPEDYEEYYVGKDYNSEYDFSDVTKSKNYTSNTHSDSDFDDYDFDSWDSSDTDWDSDW